jgi:transcriptional regulator with XRE-family HTH domain
MESGLRLREVREKLGFGGRNMNRFAKAIDYPQPSLSAIESGSRPISKVLATILTSRYNISSDWLLLEKGICLMSKACSK